MKTMLIVLENDFHNSEVTLRAKIKENSRGKYLYLSAGQVKKSQSTLCGIDGCTCGDSLGCRGANEYVFDTHPDGYAICYIDD